MSPPPPPPPKSARREKTSPATSSSSDDSGSDEPVDVAVSWKRLPFGRGRSALQVGTRSSALEVETTGSSVEVGADFAKRLPVRATSGPSSEQSPCVQLAKNREQTVVISKLDSIERRSLHHCADQMTSTSKLFLESFAQSTVVSTSLPDVTTTHCVHQTTDCEMSNTDGASSSGIYSTSLITKDLVLAAIQERDVSDIEDDRSADSPQPWPSSNESSDEESDCEHTAAQDVFVGELPDETISDDLLYRDSPLTKNESLMAILSFAHTEKLSGVAVSNLLKLVELHCPKPNNCFRSSHLLFEELRKIRSPVEAYFNCNLCLKTMESLTSSCNSCNVLNSKVDQTLVFSIEDQLTQMYQRQDFLQAIQYRFRRKKLKDENIEDIYDGLIYKEAENGVLSNRHNISLMWYADGVVLYENSELEFWPLYLVVNELSPEERCKQENLILAAVYIGKGKPHPNVYLKHVYPHVERVKQGFKVKIPDVEEPIEVKAIVLCGSCDSPARAMMFHQKYFNGLFSCPKCLSRGEKSDRTGNVFTHPIEENVVLRTEDMYVEDARRAAEENVGVPEYRRTAINGIKGPSYLYLIVQSMIRSTAIDSMHCAYLGVMKQLLELWLAEKHKDEDYSLFSVTAVVNARLMSIHPPSFVKRLPRKLGAVKLKAWELMMLLYFYLLPVFEGIMKQIYFHNFKLLVAGMSLLNYCSISPDDDVPRAQTLLSQFVSDFQNLYGYRHMSFNVHLHLHLPQTVVELGPLFITSCFRSEDLNGKLRSLIHSSRYAGSQLAKQLSVFMYLPSAVLEMNAGAAQDFCKTVGKKWKRVRLMEMMYENCFSVGKYHKHLPLPNYLSQALSEQEYVTVFIFHRIKLQGIIIKSESYRRCETTCSNYIRYMLNGNHKYGSVKTYVKLTMCSCFKACVCPGTFFAVVLNYLSAPAFSTSNPPASLFHIKKCEVTQVLHLVPVKSILNVCIFMKLDNTVYLCDPLNSMEMYN